MAVSLKASEIGLVNCPVNSNVKTEDGKNHEMGRAFPILVLPEGKNDVKAFVQGVIKWAENAGLIADGQEISITGPDGKTKTVKPTDDIPKGNTETKRKVKDGDKEVEVVTVSHGTNFPASLPVEASALVDAFNAGVKAAVYREGVKTITDEFRAEGGKRGRQAKEFSIDSLA